MGNVAFFENLEPQSCYKKPFLICFVLSVGFSSLLCTDQLFKMKVIGAAVLSVLFCTGKQEHNQSPGREFR